MQTTLINCVKQILEEASDRCDLVVKPVYQKLMLLSGPELISTCVQEKYRWSKEEARAQFNSLVLLRLGVVVERSIGRGKNVQVFVKKSLQEIQSDSDAAANFINQIREFELKCKVYKDCCDLSSIGSLSTIDADIERYLNKYRVPSRIFITKLDKCYLCYNKLDLLHKVAVNAVLFSAFGPPEYCFNFILECKVCNTKHYHSYCTKVIYKIEKRFFYKDSLNHQFISFTKLTIYECRLFEVFSADIMYKHASYQGFVDAYNAVFYIGKKVDRQLNDHRFTESWLYYNLLLYVNEFDDITKFEAPMVDVIDTS